jgi:oligopeptide/dipeptide ABC transporter ATP-binding protein
VNALRGESRHDPESGAERLGDLLRLSGVVAAAASGGASGPPRSGLDGLDLSVAWGGTTALVAEAGGGKSLLARVLMGQPSADAGSIRLDGVEISAAGRAERLRAWQRMQLVPSASPPSLDPLWPVVKSVAEPLRLLGVGRRRRVGRRALEALLGCGIGPERSQRLPAELTPGEQQRVALARALAMHPDLVILDDPMAGLDLSARSQLAERLQALQLEQGVAFLLLTRDLALACAQAERVAVMLAGRVVEVGSGRALAVRPQHPLTRALAASSSAGADDAGVGTTRFALAGDGRPTLPVDAGCALVERCPLVEPRCHARSPSLRRLAPDHRVACHQPPEVCVDEEEI